MLEAKAAASDVSPLPADWVDEIQAILDAARVPGAAVSLITPNGVSEHMFGTLNVRTGARVERTSGFQLCSVSKAYVATLGLALEHAGVLKIDDPVCPIVPEYAPEPAWLREEISFRDLVSNRLGVWQGGLSTYGLSDRYDYADLARRMSHVPRVGPFRGQYTYCNSGFCVAALAYERLTGKPFQQLLDEYLLLPAGMTQTRTGPEARAASDRASPHTINRRHELVQIPDLEDDWARPGGGGIMSTAADQQLWLRLNLGRGQLGGKQILPAAIWDELWRPHIFLKPEARHLMLGDIDVPFTAYGLGWWVTTYNGHFMAAHGGGGAGWRTYSSMLPNQGIGVSVLTNVDGKSGSAVVHRLLERCLDLPARPWFAIVRDDRAEKLDAARAALESAFPASPEVPLDPHRISGQYRNAESGEVEVHGSATRVGIRFLDGPTWDGELQPLGGANYAHEISGPFATYDGPAAPQYRVRFNEGEGEVTSLVHSYIGRFERV